MELILPFASFLVIKSGVQFSIRLWQKGKSILKEPIVKTAAATGFPFVHASTVITSVVFSQLTILPIVTSEVELSVVIKRFFRILLSSSKSKSVIVTNLTVVAEILLA